MRNRGIIMVLLSALFWGLSATASQQLFQQNHFQPGWLLSIRMLFAGTVLVLWGLGHRDPAFRTLLHARKQWIPLLLFATIGLLGVQYSYFKAIADGNAASGTLLQYLGPSLIIVYLAFSQRRLPNRLTTVAMLLALSGTWLLVSGGHFHTLVITTPALIWGLISALCLAFYTLYPITLIRQFNTVAVVGWGMLIGGIISSIIWPVWQNPHGQWSSSAILLIGFVVLFGTLMAFFLYLTSLHYLTPSETGLLATVEPISAVAASMIFLRVHLDSPSLWGAGLIITAVVLLTRSPLGTLDPTPRTIHPAVYQRKDL